MLRSFDQFDDFSSFKNALNILQSFSVAARDPNYKVELEPYLVIIIESALFMRLDINVL